MVEETILQDFTHKFSQLTETNQRYIIGIQQALSFAQAAEDSSGDCSNKKNGEAHERGIL